MSISKHQSSLLTGLYSGIRKSRLLETSPGRWLFSRSYSLYKRHLEDPFHWLIMKHPELFLAGHVIDVGANIGYTSALFAKAIDPGYRVFSFEPEAVNFSYLVQCAGRPESRGRIVPVRSAVGSGEGMISLWRNEHHHGDHRILSGPLEHTAAPSECVSVPITTIDHFVRSTFVGNPFLGNGRPLNRVAFIKVDVQGYEFPVCKGMEQTLADNPCAVIALEYCPDAISQLGFDSDEILAWWTFRGYTASTLWRNGTITTGIATDLGNNGYIDLLFSQMALPLTHFAYPRRGRNRGRESTFRPLSS